MNTRHQRRNTALFIAFILLSGFLNMISRTDSPFTDSFASNMNDFIYIGLLLFWLQSVRNRLLLSRARSYIAAIAVFMIAYLLIRVVKYNFLVSPVSVRYAVYAYWIPQMLIPALCLMACIRIRRGEEKRGKWNENLLLIPACLLSVLAMTNDLNRLIYRPLVDLSVFEVKTGTYSYGAVFYLMYVWMGATVLASLILMFRETRQTARILKPLSEMVCLWFGLILLNLLVLDQFSRYHFFNVPEIHIFCMLGIIELFIRYRLIPFNENYTGFFGKMHTPVLITDRLFHPVYRSAAEVPSEPGRLKQALSSPVIFARDKKLQGKEINAGYAFWVEDESAVHRAQERLSEANEMIEQENYLIQAETEQKEKDAYLASRHHIYHEIAEELYPWQKRISEILESAVPGGSGFKEQITKVSVLNAYVKRKTNLLLLAAEKNRMDTGELYLALEELAAYLTLAGLPAIAGKPAEGTMTADRMIAMFDAFEILAEQLVGKASSLMISWNKGGLCLAAQVNERPSCESIRLPVGFRESEGILYMDIPAQEGGTDR